MISSSFRSGTIIIGRIKAYISGAPKLFVVAAEEEEEDEEEEVTEEDEEELKEEAIG